MESMEVNREHVITHYRERRAAPGDELQEKTREFEALLIEKMLSAIQPRNGFFGGGFKGDFYQSIFLRELAVKMAQNPGLGLAESIRRALKTE